MSRHHTIALVPGTFDPPHYAHQAVVKSAAATYDRVYWAIGQNPVKSAAMFEIADRLAMMKMMADGLRNVTVTSYAGLIWDFPQPISHIVRSMRLNMDYESELNFAFNIRKFIPAVHIHCVMVEQSMLHISSTTVRELIRQEVTLQEYTTPEVADYIHGLRSGWRETAIGSPLAAPRSTDALTRKAQQTGGYGRVPNRK